MIILDNIFLIIFIIGAMSLSFCLGMPFGYFFKTYNDKQQKWIKKKLHELNESDKLGD